MSTEISQRPSSPIGFGQRGIELASYEEAFRFAKSVIASGFAPKGVDKPESVLIAMQMGAELGLPPMQAIQSVAVINGRPSLWGDALLAVCRDSGLFDESAFVEAIEGEGDKRQASCTVRRLPSGQPCTRTFSMSDAKRAGLAGKTGPWTQYPDRMLQMRARTFALRDTFTDVLRGFTSREEARDMTPIRTTATVAPIEQFLPPPSEQVLNDGEIVSGVRGDLFQGGDA